MALPKLNELPSYSVTIPSSGQETTFRPFLVKEQKALLIALETQERRDILRAVIRTINSCIEEPLSGSLTTFDVDYLFTKIRAKSVGETANIQMTCSECESVNDITVDLEDIEVDGDVPDSRIQITDDVSVQMRLPTYEDFLNNKELYASPTVTETLLHLIISCMDSILTEEERYSIKDESPEDVVNFLESMTSEQFERISKFATSIPSVSKEISFTCGSCGHENSSSLKGIDHFF